MTSFENFSIVDELVAVNAITCRLAKFHIPDIDLVVAMYGCYSRR